MLLLFLALVAPAGAQTTVILLGTGNPYPSPSRQGPATAVTVGDRFFLFDAGTGVMRQANAAGLPIGGPEACFFTHLHNDHTLGYPDLLLTSWVMHRATPFPVYGPPGPKAMTDAIFVAWKQDIDIRTHGLEAEVEGGERVDVHEVVPEAGTSLQVYDRDGVRVTAIPVHHGSWKHAYAYRLDSADRSVVITGDYAPPFDTLVAASSAVDVLVSEVYAVEAAVPEDRPGGDKWPSYLHEFHTSAPELGALAAKIGPKELVLTHGVGGRTPPEQVVAEIRKGGFSGTVIVGEDLGRY